MSGRTNSNGRRMVDSKEYIWKLVCCELRLQCLPFCTSGKRKFNVRFHRTPLLLIKWCKLCKMLNEYCHLNESNSHIPTYIINHSIIFVINLHDDKIYVIIPLLLKVSCSTAPASWFIIFSWPLDLNIKKKMLWFDLDISKIQSLYCIGTYSENDSHSVLMFLARLNLGCSPKRR